MRTVQLLYRSLNCLTKPGCSPLGWCRDFRLHAHHRMLGGLLTSLWLQYIQVHTRTSIGITSYTNIRSISWGCIQWGGFSMYSIGEQLANTTLTPLDLLIRKFQMESIAWISYVLLRLVERILLRLLIPKHWESSSRVIRLALWSLQNSAHLWNFVHIANSQF